MPKITNVGKKVESFEKLPDLHPGQSMDVPFHLGMKLWESDNFQVDWQEDELKDRDENGKRKYLGFRSPINIFDGYGIIGVNTLISAERFGLHLSMQQPELKLRYFQNTLAYLEKHYPAALPVINRQDKYPTKWALCHCISPDIRHVKAPRRALWSMWEATQFPTEFNGMNWDYWMKQADAIIVPSDGQHQIFRDSGYTGPLHTVIDGIETDSFPLVERPIDRRPFTFFTWGRLSYRKAPLELLSCFAHAFQGKTDVRLVMKTRDNQLGVVPIPAIHDDRVTVINDNWSKQRLNQALYDADCAVFMSHGEGSYNPPVQAAASGLWCIVPGHSGCSAWATPKHFAVCGLHPTEPLIDAHGLGTRDGKTVQWWNQDPDQVIEAMRWAYNNRDKLPKKGKAAASYVRRNFGVDQMMTQLVKVVNQLDD